MRHWMILSLALVLCSCYMGKTLEQQVRVRIAPFCGISILNSGNSTFSTGIQDTVFTNRFMAGLRAELQSSNVLVTDENAAFEVQFTSFSITETTKMHTVNDTTSGDHGKQFELTTLNLSASGKVVSLSNGKTQTWSADKSDSETVTCNRSMGQMITGQNKARDEYREKTFGLDAAPDLTVNCGRRSGVSIVKELMRMQ